MQYALDEITYVSVEWGCSHEMFWQNFYSTYEMIRHGHGLIVITTLNSKNRDV